MEEAATEWFAVDESEGPALGLLKAEELMGPGATRVDAMRVPKPEELSQIDPAVWVLGCPHINISIMGLGCTVTALTWLR